MCLRPYALQPVPELTALVAHAAFPKGNIYLQIRDELGSIYKDQDFAVTSLLGLGHTLLDPKFAHIASEIIVRV